MGFFYDIQPKQTDKSLVVFCLIHRLTEVLFFDRITKGDFRKFITIFRLFATVWF